MSVVAKVESVWRYPVKSMRGEALDQAYFGFAGVYGDRVYAIADGAAEAGFPWLTGRELREMILYQPRFRDARSAAFPPNLRDAQALGPGVTPRYAGMEDLALDVVAPDGEVLAIDDPRLLRRLGRTAGDTHGLSLVRSHRALTDCRPVSLISLQTVAHLAEACGTAVDKRQFRANLYLDLDAGEGFAEDAFVGRSLHIGDEVVVSVLERDPRCAMITLDPETAKANPLALRHVAKHRGGMAGLYAAVLKEGVVRAGDEVRVGDGV